jgi:hypothetical protein
LIRLTRPRALFSAAFLLCLLAATAAVTSGASAGVVTPNTCTVTLTDSVGGTWDLNNGSGVNGAVDDGSLQPEDRSDAYDTWTVLNLSDDGGTSWTPYADNDPNAFSLCTSEDNGRELVMPAVTFADGLNVSRKVYVPDSGLAFARFLNVVSNPTAAPITVTLDIAGGRSDNGDLGSDSNTMVTGSSSGDAATTTGDMTEMGTNDDWATTADDPTNPGDPTLTHVWQLRSSLTDTADSVGIESGEADELHWQYNNVTIQPGQTVVYMSLEAMRRTIAESIDAANALVSDPADIYAGMSSDELAQLANFRGLDGDRDGVADAQDNCPDAANADQADLDGDGQGDACDNDIDGDGLSNSTENEIGTDPRKADTDGDGVNDKADACPKKAGTGADGCPAEASGTTTPPKDTTPPSTQITSVTSVADVNDLLNGVNVTITCDEDCQNTVRMLGKMPTGQAFLSATNGGFNKVLGRTTTGYASGKRVVRVLPCLPRPGAAQSKSCLKRLRKAASHRRSFLVKIFVISRDRAGNQTQTSKLIRVLGK